MRTTKSDKIKLAKERLELKLEKQKYVLYRDYLSFKDTYSPVKLATKVALKNLKGDTDKDPLEAIADKERSKLKKSKQLDGVKDLLLHLFMLGESFLSPSSEKEDEDEYWPDFPEELEEGDDQYVIGRDDV